MRGSRLAVDLRGSLGLTGTLVKYLSLSAFVPAVVAIAYRRAALAVPRGCRVRGSQRGSGWSASEGRRSVGFREGYLVISLTWLLAAVFGAIPYLLSGEPQLEGPVDAFFESMSGFSTTNASILTHVDTVDHSMLLWRQLTQWVGGMGIIVLALAVLPRLRVGGRQLLDSESPGDRDRPARRTGSGRPSAGCGCSTSALTSCSPRAHASSEPRRS